MKQSFREASEGVRLVIVQPFHIVALARISCDFRLPEFIGKTEFVAFGRRNLRGIESNEITRFQHISFEQDDDCPSASRRGFSLSLFLPSLGYVLLSPLDWDCLLTIQQNPITVLVCSYSNTSNIHPILLGEPQHWRGNFDSVAPGGEQNSGLVVEFEICPAVFDRDYLLVGVFCQKFCERFSKI